MSFFKNNEFGVGILGTVNGVIAFLALLLFALQVLVGLYASSVVSAVTWDTARRMAAIGMTDTPRQRQLAEIEARESLGSLGDNAVFNWAGNTNTLELTVRAQKPGFLPSSLRKPLRLDTVTRTVKVRREIPR